MLRRGPASLYTGIPTPRRGGRAAEGTRLLSEYGDQNSIAGSNPALSVDRAGCDSEIGPGPLRCPTILSRPRECDGRSADLNPARRRLLLERGAVQRRRRAATLAPGAGLARRLLAGLG